MALRRRVSGRGLRNFFRIHNVQEASRTCRAEDGRFGFARRRGTLAGAP
jgi:hypothetical protein